MNARRRLPKAMAGVLACLAVIGLFAWSPWSKKHEVEAIKRRYQAFKTALAAGDDAAIKALMAPGSYGSEGANLFWIENHAAPLTKDSDVEISGSRAIVIPRREYNLFYFIPIPGGNGVKMIKVDDEWFFTGGISID